MYEKLKSFNANKIFEMEELVEMSLNARSLAAEYSSLALDLPDWLTEATDLIRTEIASRTRASDLRELQGLQRDLDDLKTREERRKEKEAKLAALQNRLGLAAKTS